ncbi:phage tail tube protein [Rickettsiales bacterium]|nr:phage tail tube protein [Rickettsiales bacterium]
MTAKSGWNLILKVGDGSAPTEIFAEIEGIKLTSIELVRNSKPAVNLSSGAWQKLESNQGVSSIIINANGTFEDGEAEETLRAYAFAGTINNFEVLYPNSDLLSGAFLITRYERRASSTSLEEYNITLQSAGNINFTPA